MDRLSTTSTKPAWVCPSHEITGSGGPNTPGEVSVNFTTRISCRPSTSAEEAIGTSRS